VDLIFLYHQGRFGVESHRHSRMFGMQAQELHDGSQQGPEVEEASVEEVL
jgi:hypothetical protein